MIPGKTLLMLCASLGLGNSTRLLAIVQALRRRPGARPESLRIVVGTGGNAARFWSANGPGVGAELLPLDAYEFAPPREPASRLDWSGFLRLDSLRTYARNTLALRSFLKSNRVDLAVADSDYHGLPLLASRTPLVFLGQAWDVVRRCASPESRSGVSAASLLVERLDLFYQRRVGERILVPAFEPASSTESRVTTVPLIVREEFAAAAPPDPAAGPLRALLGGSGIGSAPLLEYARRHGLPVLQSGGDGAWALDEKGAPLIDPAPAVLIQGGLSSISECIARRKKMIVVPIDGHAEQLANAREVERLGLGVRASEPMDPPDRYLERLERLEPAWPRVDGAEVVARLLLRSLGCGSEA